jgi:hypothetical protein
VTGTKFTAVLDPLIPPGSYQVRVVGVLPTGEVLCNFSDAITVTLGPLPTSRPAMTAPDSGAVRARGARVVFGWTEVPGVTRYLLEFTRPGGQFATPNATELDPANALGSLVVAGSSLDVVIPPDVRPAPTRCG